MQKLELEEVYRSHHEKGARYGYLYCHGARFPFLKEWVGSNKRVLDLGCRDGMLTQSFAEDNEVIGADIDRKALHLCEERLGIKTVWLDLNHSWPWEEETFDVIVACEIVEHLFFLPRFLQNVERTLKKNGVFIGSVPNGFRMRNRWKFLFGKEYETDPTHVRRFSIHSLSSQLEKYFSDIQIVPIEGKILPFWKVSKNTPVRLGSIFAKDLLWIAKKI
jgi:2-polyprenyl-3-methyl-5-hydroxy-6-metoxy-1,4-benzoquinol methylase